MTEHLKNNRPRYLWWKERQKAKKATVERIKQERAKRSNIEQLARLDNKFGKDKGATKERQRLNK